MKIKFETIGFENLEALRSEQTREQINKMRELEIVVVEPSNRGEVVKWDDIDNPTEDRTLLRAIEQDRDVRVNQNTCMADRPNLCILTIIDEKIERIEFYEGHDALECTCDLKSLRLMKYKLPYTYSERCGFIEEIIEKTIKEGEA